jgi:hypothetical protein
MFTAYLPVLQQSGICYRLPVNPSAVRDMLQITCQPFSRQGYVTDYLSTLQQTGICYRLPVNPSAVRDMLQITCQPFSSEGYVTDYLSTLLLSGICVYLMILLQLGLCLTSAVRDGTIDPHEVSEVFI